VLRFKRAVVATGTKAGTLEVPRLDDVGYLTGETALSLNELPQRLAVLGAGSLGCELAQAFARFGATVDLIETGPHLLGREDFDAGRIVAQALRDDGVRIHAGAAVERVSREGTSKMLALRDSDGRQWLSVDEILVVAPRVANVDGLELEAAGIAFDPIAGLRLNDRLQTTNRRVFAAGGVCAPSDSAQATEAAARLVVRNALFFGRAKASALAVPACTFTDPEVARVGLSPREALERGIPIDTIDVPLAGVARAVVEGRTDGFVKVHVRRESDRIVGATIVAAHASEMAAELSLAMTVGLSRVARTRHPYLTHADALLQVADRCHRARRHPWRRTLLEKWLAWTR
jgi:pyruvate/2-oxoglutarate dehydrogenase complex dihydrolipoamide dehydrogenase (E3) component